jgi:HEAT repeat protein
MDRGFLILSVTAGILLVSSFSFAILALGLRLGNDRQARRHERLAKRWEPAMLEVLGGAAEPEAIQDRVDDKDGLLFLSFLLGYARLLRGDEITLVRTVARPYLPRVLPRLRRGTAESRGNAVLILARMGMPEYAEAVAGALDDDSPVVSMIAARSLFRPGQEEHFPAVLAHLPRFTGWSRSFLASMLAGGGPKTAPLLRDIMRNPEEPALVRAVASDALRELNDLDSVPVAVELITNETDRELLAGSLRILKQLGHHEHVSFVQTMAASRDPVIRATAVSTLGALGGPPEIPLLQEKLDDPSFWVSLEAARGLLALGESRTLERLAATEGPWSMLARQVLSE